jgi:hypothetical protein
MLLHSRNYPVSGVHASVFEGHSGMFSTRLPFLSDSLQGIASGRGAGARVTFSARRTILYDASELSRYSDLWRGPVFRRLLSRSSNSRRRA